MSNENTSWFEEVYGGDIGSPDIECICGRTHFASDQGSMIDPGVLVRYRMQAKAEPKRYIEDATVDAISAVTILGNPYVIGCECGHLQRYEEQIWSERSRILDYFSKRQGHIDTTNQLLGEQIKSAKGVTDVRR